MNHKSNLDKENRMFNKITEFVKSHKEVILEKGIPLGGALVGVIIGYAILASKQSDELEAEELDETSETDDEGQDPQ